jgi:hypothetical protein
MRGKPVVTVRHPEIRVSVVPEARSDFRIVDHVTKECYAIGKMEFDRLLSVEAVSERPKKAAVEV